MAKVFYKNLNKIISFVVITAILFSSVPETSPVFAATSPWTQTDWSGGSGQTNWVDSTKFYSSSNVDISSQGQVTLQATSNWYNSSWAYRKPITIDNSQNTNTLTDYQVLATLDTQSLISAGKMRVDCGDIRFTDSNGTTSINYWLESGCNSTSTKLWVKVPSISASSTKTIYIYYGNSSATSVSNATQTFLWADDFEGSTGSLLPPYSQVDISSGNNTIVAEFQKDGAGNAFEELNTDWHEHYITAVSHSDVAIRTIWKRENSVNYGIDPLMWLLVRGQSAGNYYGIGFGGWNDAYVIGKVAGGGYTELAYAGAEATNTEIVPGTYLVEGRLVGNEIKLVVNDIEKVSVTDTTYTSGTIVGIANRNYKSRWQFLALRQYTSPEPIVGTPGTEEQYIPTPGTLTSSIFDTGYTAGAAWGILTYTATTPANTSVEVKARTSNSSSMEGATDFSSCDAITSGSDISSNNCVTDSHRYIQYQFTLANTDSISTPVFQDISINFSAYDTTPPSISLTPLSPDPTTNTTPSLTGTATDTFGTVANVQFQMDSTSGSWSDCTADDGTFDEASEDFTCTVSSALSEGNHTMYVRATDSDGNTTADADVSSDEFTIDTTAPARSDGSPSGSQPAGTTEVSMSLTTDENATCRYSSTAGTAYSSMTDNFSTTGGTSHSVTISGLSNGQSYNYYVRCIDGANNANSDDYTISFSIASPPPSGGGGMPIAWLNPPKTPEGGFRVLINNDEKYTNNPTVTLNLFGGIEAARMAISNNPEFFGLGSTGQIPYQSSYQWNLCQGRDSCLEGEYKVYVQFFASWGKSSGIVSDTIIYQKEKPIAEEIKEIPKKITEEVKKIPEVIKKIPEVFKPKPPELAPKEVPIEELVPKEAPLTFQGKWQLLPSESIKEFVLSPLPKSIRNLAEKFPELEKTFEKVGISKITDVAKLRTVKLTLPGLTERVGLPTAKVEPGKFALAQGVPVAKLSPTAKQQLPTEIVFAKTGGELIDFNIALVVSEKGEPQQKIATISGKPLQLVVKPDKPVKSVKGYVVFKSKARRSTSLELPLNSLLASLIFANPVFAKLQEKPVRVEEKLVLLEFEYTDPDGDGIYTAQIQAPLVEGKYEIITVMDFEDPELGKKEIRLITVVDPEGYIYEKDGDKETRIPGAIVSLFWLNPETKQYELWPAKKYQQENPQTTDVRGTYSFLVPEGYYYIKVEAPGYLVYDGKPFQVKEGSGIHINIELKTKYWWLKVVDWRTILLIVVILFLIYNFYRDRIREKILSKK